ncbi:T-cell receptor beta chain V region CTL-F3 [Microtus ochrogaster]|nr:T-cell receptor beta chain V region CTL-F3 [Microtus ochrogaster]
MWGTALPGSAWGPSLLCCVTVFLLGTSSASPGVIQSPRHIIKAKGGRSILKCIPISGHDTVFWYQQTLGKELKFLIQHFEKTERVKGNIPNRFSVQQFSDYHSEMNMSALQLEDSAVYFCASSSQPYRVTDFLSLNFPVPVSDTLVRDGEMPHSLRQGQEILIALYKSLIGVTQIVLNTGVGSKIPSCFSVSVSTSQLLASGSASPGVIQSPRHIIKAKGGSSFVKCTPISGHNTVFWYQQTLGQELKFLIRHYEKVEGEKGNIPNRFSVQQFSDFHSEMNMSALQLEDSAVYFCASSPQPHRVTGFLSLNLPALASFILERGRDDTQP